MREKQFSLAICNARLTRGVTKFEFEFNNDRTLNFFTRFEIQWMF